jgi:phenylacetate-CoA ligase
MYDNETVAALREQLAAVADHDLYRERFAAAGVEPDEIETWAAFESVPFTTPEDLVDDFEADPPTGSTYDDAAMVTFSPIGDGLRPVIDTADDLDHQAAANATGRHRVG